MWAMLQLIRQLAQPVPFFAMVEVTEMARGAGVSLQRFFAQAPVAQGRAHLS
jgi:hypothetical protein